MATLLQIFKIWKPLERPISEFSYVIVVEKKRVEVVQALEVTLLNAFDPIEPEIPWKTKEIMS